MRVIGYTRVSTAEQGLGLAAQRTTIQAEAERRGWDVQWIEDDGFSAKDLKRPGIQQALTLLATGRAEALVTAKLDRLSRSVIDFSQTLSIAKKQGWAVVLLDIGVDTTTPSGKLLAGVMAQFAEYERELISTRTRDALAELNAQGKQVGRRSMVPAATVQQITALHDANQSPSAIARCLTDRSVPRPDGKVLAWTPAAVVRVLTREARYVATARPYAMGKAGRRAS